MYNSWASGVRAGRGSSSRCRPLRRSRPAPRCAPAPSRAPPASSMATPSASARRASGSRASTPPRPAQTCKRKWFGSLAVRDGGDGGARRADRRTSPVSCEPRGLDKYGRTLAVCFVDGRDINAQMVRQGYAWAFVRYSHDLCAGGGAGAKPRASASGRASRSRPGTIRAKRWAAAEQQAPRGLRHQGQHHQARPHLPHALEPLVRADQDRAGQGQALVLHEAEALAAGLAAGAGALVGLALWRAPG